MILQSTALWTSHSGFTAARGLLTNCSRVECDMGAKDSDYRFASGVVETDQQGHESGIFIKETGGGASESRKHLVKESAYLRSRTRLWTPGFRS